MIRFPKLPKTEHVRLRKNLATNEITCNDCGALVLNTCGKVMSYACSFQRRREQARLEAQTESEKTNAEKSLDRPSSGNVGAS